MVEVRGKETGDNSLQPKLKITRRSENSTKTLMVRSYGIG